MRDFPHKFRENEMPISIIKKKKFDEMHRICDKILGMWNITEEDRLAKAKYLGFSI